MSFFYHGDMAIPKHAHMNPADDSFLFDPGPNVRISATVPKNILLQVRGALGKRGLSAFVTKALRRELIRINRAKYVAMVESESGPLPEALLARARRILSQ